LIPNFTLSILLYVIISPENQLSSLASWFSNMTDLPHILNLQSVVTDYIIDYTLSQSITALKTDKKSPINVTTVIVLIHTLLCRMEKPASVVPEPMTNSIMF